MVTEIFSNTRRKQWGHG